MDERPGSRNEVSPVARTTAEVVERAIGWASAREGSTDYERRCLAFLEDAYERANGIEVFGAASAREAADLYGARTAGDEPVRGSFVFYDWAGFVDGEQRDWGHVGLAIGDGRVVHAWDRVRIDAIRDVEALSAGGVSPRYVGWAPPERVLAGHRRRSWE